MSSNPFVSLFLFLLSFLIPHLGEEGGGGPTQTTGQPGGDGAGNGKEGPAQGAGGPATPMKPDEGTVTPPGDALSLEPQKQAEPEYTPSDTGDVGLDLALDYFAKLGIKDDDPALDRARNGDFALLEAKLAVLGDKAKGHEKYLALGRQAYEGIKAAAEAKSAATLKVVYEAAGGEANWAAIKTWVGQNADPNERAVLTAGINQGGIVAKAVVSYLSTLYNSKVGKAPASAVREDATGRAPVGQPLTARGYSDEVAALHARMGARMEGSPEYRALAQRRAAARAAGY